MQRRTSMHDTLFCYRPRTSTRVACLRVNWRLSSTLAACASRGITSDDRTYQNRELRSVQNNTVFGLDFRTAWCSHINLRLS
jgi:hypothetical protein